jgi:lipoate-protein ligase A
MLIYMNSETDPHLNLALEERLLAAAREDCFMLWRNRPAIIVGRNQNTAEEINAAFVSERGIAVVRRLSGGGAVYHDLGNLNYTFVSPDSRHAFDFARFAQPVLAALRGLGVAAEFSGRNDLLIDGRKFSGNAQYVQGGKVLHHGTLLFDSDLTVLGRALAVRPDKFAGKGIKSVASRVTNIAPHLPAPLTIDAFAAALAGHVREAFASADAAFTAEDHAAARALAADKYGRWEWNYGKSAPYNFSNCQRFAGGLVECRLFVEGGVIRTAKIYGDFFGNRDIGELEQALAGVRHHPEAVARALAAADLAQYFAGISRDELLTLFL